MDFSTVLTAPVIIILVLVAALGAFAGHAKGRAAEALRKAAALEQAGQQSRAALAAARDEHREQMEVLKKAAHNDLDMAKHAGEQQLERLQAANREMVESLRSEHAREIARQDSEHGALIDRLNAANLANLNALQEERARQSAELSARSTAALEDAERRRQAALSELKREHGEALAGLRAERDNLGRRVGELEHEIRRLHDEVREARLKNMFSVSKSGEKLVRVVRSVQELANELDETSRTVTDGEYSFFAEIKDQRDREAVLSLTGGGSRVVSEDQAADDQAEIEQAMEELSGHPT
jgi:hypothetical protein